MTSYSRHSVEKESNNSFSHFLDSKYPTNSRSNFTFHQFPLGDSPAIDESLIKRFALFAERAHKYQKAVNIRLLTATKEVESLENNLESKVNDNAITCSTLLETIDQSINNLSDSCYEMMQEKMKTQDEECRWMTKQMTQIKSGFKEIQREREEEIQAKLKDLQEDIEGLRESLEKQKALRDQISENQIQDFGEQILKIQQMLSVQREQRMYNNQSLLQQIEEMDGSLQKMLEEERETREKKEALFTSLLEETYIKLQRY